MKNRMFACVLAVLLAFSAFTAGAQYNTLVYMEQGGAKLVAESGGEVEVRSGGTLDVQSGATATLAGTINLSGTVTQSGTFSRTGQEFQFGSDAKVGATSGWVVAAATDVGRMATLPASQSASTLVVIIDGLRVGDIITGIRVVGQIESAGGTVTLDASLRSLTAAAADLTDAAVTGGGITQVSVTADSIVNATKTGIAETVAANKKYYILITGTTAGSTDIDLMGVSVTVTQQ